MRTIEAGETGADFSFAKPPAARLVELGYTFIVGYWSVPPSAPKKNLTKAEADIYEAAGLEVYRVWEMSSSRATLGATYGSLDGFAAKALAEADNWPRSKPLLVADDCSTTTANLPAKIDYMRAFHAAYARDIGIYGGVKILTPLVGLWKIGWVPISAWSWSVNLTRLPNETTAAYNQRGRDAATQAARDVGAHVLQGKSFYLDGVWSIDPNTTISPWPTPVAPPPPPLEEPMTPYVFKLADGGLGIRHESGARSVNDGELQGPLKAEVVWDIPAGSNWEAWIKKELGRYVRELDPLVITIPPIQVPSLTGKITADLGAAGRITGSIG